MYIRYCSRPLYLPASYTTQFTFLFIYLLLPLFFSINLFFYHTHTHTHNQPTIHSLSSCLSLNLPFSLPSSLTPSASHLLLSETLSERTLSRYGLAQWTAPTLNSLLSDPKTQPRSPVERDETGMHMFTASLERTGNLNRSLLRTPRGGWGGFHTFSLEAPSSSSRHGTSRLWTPRDKMGRMNGGIDGTEEMVREQENNSLKSQGS